jgi:hypothetical protein
MFPGPDLSTIVPLFIAIIFILVVAILGYRILRATAEWVSNNHQPVEALPAIVRVKRTEVHGFSGESTRTDYYVTFELRDGVRREVRVSGEAYGQMAEGDEGTLTIQGTRFHNFVRTSQLVTNA